MKAENRNALLWTAAGLGAVLLAKKIITKAREIDLRDKVVLITGGSRGLGLVLARQFAAEGAKIGAFVKRAAG